LLVQGEESCSTIVLKPNALGCAHSSQLAPAGGEVDAIKGVAMLPVQGQQLLRTLRSTDKPVQLARAW